MKSELVIDVQPSEVSIALLEDSRLVSLQKEARNIAYAVGDIYKAKVRKLLPGLNAAFVNVGYEKDAFYTTWTSGRTSRPTPSSCPSCWMTKNAFHSFHAKKSCPT